MKLEEAKLHLIERVSDIQAAQSGHEKAIEKVRRDQEEQTTVIVRHVPTQRVFLTILQKALESEKVWIFFPMRGLISIV